ncbi:MAG: hypothetical protein DHS20C15_34900 [Planctomycetota bacterium]|nr:MAG: hypothetical protein DHS20C15_34900 [Planctomycetota bacterium]
MGTAFGSAMLGVAWKDLHVRFCKFPARHTTRRLIAGGYGTLSARPIESSPSARLAQVLAW